MLKTKYMRLTLLTAALGAAAISGQVLAEKMTNTVNESATKNVSKKAALSAPEQKMLMTLAQGNMAEVASARLALTKSTNPDVLSFAKQMNEDHSKALEEIGELATNKGLELPKATDAKHADALKKMNTLSKAEFDKQYLAKAGVEDHTATVKLLKEIQAKAKDADFKALAKKLEPTVQAHLDKAHLLHKK